MITKIHCTCNKEEKGNASLFEQIELGVQHEHLRTDASFQVVVNESKEMKGLDSALANSMEVEKYLRSDNLFPVAVKILRLDKNIPNSTGITDNIVTISVKVGSENVSHGQARMTTIGCCNNGCRRGR